MQFDLVTPEEKIASLTADYVCLPAPDGYFGIAAGHQPLIAILGDGDVTITTEGRDTIYLVSGGFVDVKDDVITVLANRARTA